MIITDLDLRRALVKAVAKDRYLVMVAYVDKEKKTIEHFYKTVNFFREDIPNTLNKFAEMLEPEVSKLAEDNS